MPQQYNATAPTIIDGNKCELQATSRGELLVRLSSGGVPATSSVDNLDAVAVSSAAEKPLILNRSTTYNGTSWDRTRGNVDVTGLASAARTTTTNSGDLTNYNGKGLHVVVDVTSAGTGSITITIQGKDSVSGAYYTLLAGAAITTVSTNVYRVYPGLTASANAVASDILPRTYRLLVTHNNANTITYSVGASVIL